MIVMHDIAEARASALSLRATAQACGSEQGPLRFRLKRAAESLEAMVLLAVRGIDRVEQLEQELRQLKAEPDKTHALMIACGSTLDTEDFELILRALDVLDRLMKAELADRQDTAAGETRSRILIVRAKLQAMEVQS
jgi:hypothetical protein